MPAAPTAAPAAAGAPTLPAAEAPLSAPAPQAAPAPGLALARAYEAVVVLSPVRFEVHPPGSRLLPCEVTPTQGGPTGLALPRAHAATARAVGGPAYLTRRMVTLPGAQAAPGDDPPAEPTDPDLGSP